MRMADCPDARRRQLGLTPGSAMLKTPHLQGLLQQLRISTPSLGAQVPPMLLLCPTQSSHAAPAWCAGPFAIEGTHAMVALR